MCDQKNRFHLVPSLFQSFVLSPFSVLKYFCLSTFSWTEARMSVTKRTHLTLAIRFALDFIGRRVQVNIQASFSEILCKEMQMYDILAKCAGVMKWLIYECVTGQAYVYSGMVAQAYMRTDHGHNSVYGNCVIKNNALKMHSLLSHGRHGMT